MILETLTIIISITKLHGIESYASTSKKMQPAEPMVEDTNLKPEEIARIKSYLQSMNHYNDDQAPRMRDPSTYCRSFQTCYECVKSMWFPCGWCHNYGCTENPEKLCPYAETLADKSNITGEAKACPHIYHDGPIMVPAGVRINIKVNLYVPDPIIYDKEIICQIKVKGKLTHLKGLLLNNVVYCYPVILNSEATQYGESDSGTVTLIWGGVQPYSNEISLILYKCEILGMDCDSCKVIPSVYGCGWCDRSSKCVTAEKCSDDMMKWTLNRLTCEHYDSIQSYCTSFSSCLDCKRAGSQCDWCHELGCTHYPTLHCPQKVFLDNIWHKNSGEKYCTEIVSSDPIFVPANIRRFIKLNLKIDDLTLYKRNIMCEIHIEQAILRVKGSIGESSLYCDMTTLRIMRNVALGYVRLLWGGAEPYSNMILMVVYRCEFMASNCLECQALDKRFNCGWCEETSKCIILEECPRQAGPWIDRKSLCRRYRDAAYLNKRDMSGLMRYSSWKSHSSLISF